MVEATKKAKKTKKQRKYGRNAASCQAYAASNRRERNKAVRLKKHLAQFPGDKVAVAAKDRCVLVIRGY
jgi:hypothetical protein